MMREFASLTRWDCKVPQVAAGGALDAARVMLGIGQREFTSFAF
jgi:hypothetical protein